TQLGDLFCSQMLLSFRTLIFLASAARIVSAATVGPVGSLVVANKTISPDGIPRAAVLAGGTFPGTLVTGNMSDNFQLTVVDQQEDNRMLEPTSIHWHGLFQNGTNYMDGPAFINQCRSEQELHRTYWYHSHLATQYCDGLRGAMVIYDPADAYLSQYDVDDESTVITLSDWYNVFAETVTGVGTPSSMLINGLGRTAATLDNTTLAVINVTQGLRYRFRLVNTACDSNYVFQIDGHTNLTIIEADGVLHEPLSVDSIQIYAAQRYSFILTADQAIDNYWIRANPNTGPTGFTGGINSAILRYVGANASEPTTSQDTSTNGLINEVDLHPLVNPGAPGGAFSGGADVQLNMALAFDLTCLECRQRFRRSAAVCCGVCGTLFWSAAGVGSLSLPPTTTASGVVPLPARIIPTSINISADVDSMLIVVVVVEINDVEYLEYRRTPPTGSLIISQTTFKFTINGDSFVPPTVPVLLQILSGAESAQSLLPNGSVYSLPHFASVEITLAGGVVGGGHPFHLHGHTFDVIRAAGSTTYNYVNPARRDVVNIGVAGDNVTIRFFTDNRGPWFLHCHIDWHLEAGFAVVMAEDVADWESELIPTSEWNQLCPTYNGTAGLDHVPCCLSVCSLMHWLLYCLYSANLFE
ncbi:unnamed protein product, partial [Mycena citricolor]